MTLADLLRSRGVNISWVAAEVGVSKQFLHKVARGEKPCPEALIPRLQDVLCLQPPTRTEIRKLLNTR